MTLPRYFGPDPAQSRLRATLATLDRRIRLVSEAGLGEDLGRRLRVSFVALSEQLALGPEPEVRSCPQCGCVGMRAATICGNCWTRLGVLAAIAPGSELEV